MGWRTRWPMGHGSHGSWVKSSMGHLGHGSLWVTHSLLCLTEHPASQSKLTLQEFSTRQRWSNIVKSLKRKTGTDTWNTEVMTLQKMKSSAYDSAFFRQPKHHPHDHLHNVLPEPGPHHSAGHSDVRRVQCVSFNYRATVYPADAYDRRGPWMHAAVDRMRFRRRIEKREVSLAPVLNEKHRRIIRMRWCNI